MHAVPVLQGPTRDDRDLPRGWQGLLFNVHYARSVACQQSPRGIATVVQPNSPADIDARGSEAAAGVCRNTGTLEAQWRAPAAGSAGPGEIPRHILYMIY